MSQEPLRPKRVCVVGAGAAGLSCAWSLSQYPDKFEVRLLAKGEREGKERRSGSSHNTTLLFHPPLFSFCLSRCKCLIRAKQPEVYARLRISAKATGSTTASRCATWKKNGICHCRQDRIPPFLFSPISMVPLSYRRIREER